MQCVQHQQSTSNVYGYGAVRKRQCWSAGKPAAMAWKKLETTASASASSSEEEEGADWCEEGSSEEEEVADSCEEEGKHSSKKAQAMASQHPLADALFSELGACLDAGEAERKLYNDLAEKLW